MSVCSADFENEISTLLLDPTKLLETIKKEFWYKIIENMLRNNFKFKMFVIFLDGFVIFMVLKQSTHDLKVSHSEQNLLDALHFKYSISISQIR